VTAGGSRSSFAIIGSRIQPPAPTRLRRRSKNRKSAQTRTPASKALDEGWIIRSENIAVGPALGVLGIEAADPDRNGQVILEKSGGTRGLSENKEQERWGVFLTVVLLVAAIIFFTGVLSPPSLMDDVDAVQAQIARNMLTSGDWVTSRIDGVVYFEKSPLVYWIMALAYKVLGVHDWAARIPIALSAVGLAWLTAAFGKWAFGKRAGFYAGLVMASCIGLWLFTRILIPDVMLTFTIALAMWAFLRTQDEEEARPFGWACIFAASLALGFLLKSLVGVVFPIAAIVVYLVCTRQLFSRRVWQRLHPWWGLAIFLAIAAPWHVLATIRNPPYFAWTLKSGPDDYHGFLWFYFINEQLLRFLNLRYPRDYNTVPRLWFWLFHLIWLFPWTVYLPAACRMNFRPVDRAGRTRLFALCWIGFILVFFTFSTTQEYYSMPCYPALALLLGAAMTADDAWVRRGTRVLSAVCATCAVAAVAILVAVHHASAPGDISAALTHHPKVYSLSLGHMEDLTLDSFAYLRMPLALAAVAFAIGAIGTLRSNSTRAYLAAACMMVVFFQGARLALIRFDPLMSSRELAQVILQDPPGTVIVDHHYYTFSSIAFYTGRPELLLNGRWNNFEYGSHAPDAPPVFLDDQQLHTLWSHPQRYYLVAKADQLPRFDNLLGAANFRILKTSGGKVLLTNKLIAP
jgi:4-amino-4-deoxy-L-arabinose transferase-like glycosyltransferase